MSINLTTLNPGTYVLGDLGDTTYIHPVTDDISLVFDMQSIRRSADLQAAIDAGNIEVKDAGGKVVGTLATMGATVPPGDAFVEKWASFASPSNNIWVTVTLSGISANTLVVILAETASQFLRWTGVRAVGSSFDRRIEISGGDPHPAIGTAATFFVKTDSSSQIQVYTEASTLTTFYVQAEL